MEYVAKFLNVFYVLFIFGGFFEKFDFFQLY